MFNNFKEWRSEKMNGEHYLSKIERNANVLDKAPEEIKNECLQNIVWARDLSKRLVLLDYNEREAAIDKIHYVLDADYKKMGFGKEESIENISGRNK